MISVSSEDLELIISKIEDALVLHDKWRENLHRTIACRLSPEEGDLRENAHHLCSFGRWLYSKTNVHFQQMTAFKNIEMLHRRMHESARDICLRIKVGGLLTTDEYDRFQFDIIHFREELTNLQHRVSYTLHNIDPLTSAFKESQLLPDLRRAQKKLVETGDPYSLLLIDIDLKETNKVHGRQMGDKVLHATIDTVRKVLSAGDKIYRLGGAEFVICLPHKKMEGAEHIKEQLLATIGDVLAEVTGNANVALDIHYGIVELEPNTYLEELLDQAARYTYAVKI